MIEVYKILTDRYDVDADLHLQQQLQRDHSLKLANTMQMSL